MDTNDKLAFEYIKPLLLLLLNINKLQKQLGKYTFLLKELKVSIINDLKQWLEIINKKAHYK